MSEEEVTNSNQLSVNSEQINTENKEQTSSSQGESLEVPKLEASATLKTQGVRSVRADAGRRVLERAAKAAAKTGRRGDVHEYMRLRRNYV